MKDMWNSFLQTVIQFVKDLATGMNRAMHRNAVLMAAGISVATMVAGVAGDLHVGGHNAMIAFAETQVHETVAETELEEVDSEESATDKENIDETNYNEEHMNGTEEAAPTVEDTEETDEAEDKEHAKARMAEETVTEPAKEIDPEDVHGLSEEEKRSHPGYDEHPDDVKEVVVLSDSDYNTLLRIVQAESGGCDIIGKILVANVILNRVDSDEFPDTIYDVVYQKYQFSPVIDGSINRCKVTDETKEAVDRALNGEDPSEGALYFMNRKKSAAKNVRWFDSKLDYLFKHGEHEFFK